MCTFDGGADIATGAARARELGVPFDGIAGQFNAITDVRGVEVGHTTIVEGRENSWLAVQATEEAIVNALVAAETMRGVNDNTFYALPHERLREVLKKYNRLAEKQD